jgi:exosome complex component RRP46
VLSRADGSARWAQGGTSVLAAVYGPIEAPTGRQHAERAVVEVVFRPRSGPPGPAERHLESLVRQAAEGVVVTALHPRTIIQIVLQVEAADGSLLACALNAAGAALVDAGVPMSSPLGEQAASSRLVACIPVRDARC